MFLIENDHLLRPQIRRFSNFMQVSWFYRQIVYKICGSSDIFEFYSSLNHTDTMLIWVSPTKAIIGCY